MPTSSLKGDIWLPASKSYSIRAFMVASCGGQSTIINPSDCDDAVVSRHVAAQLGSSIKHKGNNVWRVLAQNRRAKLSTINVRESGTVLRFVLPLAAITGQKSKIIGEGTLPGRPNAFLVKTLRAMGLQIEGKGKDHSIPILINGGRIHGGKITIEGTISSQFISALLIAAPLLLEDTHLTIEGKEIVSTDYITMTLQILEKSGVKIHQVNSREFLINGRQKYKGLKDFVVPSDYGLAAFLLAAGCITTSSLHLRGNLDDRFIQADAEILNVLKKMGVRFQKSKTAIKLKGPCDLKGGRFSLKNAPDLVPITAVLAMFAKGSTHITDIYHARAKESDRISDLRHELLKVGADIKETKNALIIHPRSSYRNNVLLDPHHDHRLAMAFSVLGVRLGVRVRDIECSSKSYPGFVRDFRLLGVKLSKNA